MREYKPMPKVVRCAIYTRKSTDEGLEQEFNSLDAQREAGEAYVNSQRHEGWQVIPDLYDDGGFSGGNLDRPALRRLLRDIQDGKVECVIVYKVDRLSRSLTDFSKILDIFDRHNVSFVSVTQAFNTASSMGRLILNVLFSFAQFEREIISERTKDKMSAARRKGKFVGGLAVLGFDATPQKKLQVNPEEAERVRTIFDLYLQRRSLLETAQELNRRGWRTKHWVTKSGKERGGLVWDKNNLRQLLINPAYVGKLVFKGEVHDAEHESIIDEPVWQRVQCQLERNARSGGSEVRNEFAALLKGKLRCATCDCAMVPSHSTRNGKRFRYYRCDRAMKQGKHLCPTRSIPAGEIEAFVVGQIKKLASDPDLVTDTIAAARRQVQAEIHNSEQELTSLQRDLAHWNGEVGRLAAHVGPSDVETPTTKRLAELHDRIRTAERRGPELLEQLRELQTRLLDEAEVRVALQQFDPVWKALTPAEQVRVVDLLVESVSYNGNAGKVAVTFHPAGLQAFANEFINQETNA